MFPLQHSDGRAGWMYGVRQYGMHSLLIYLTTVRHLADYSEKMKKVFQGKFTLADPGEARDCICIMMRGGIHGEI